MIHGKCIIFNREKEEDFICDANNDVETIFTYIHLFKKENEADST